MTAKHPECHQAWEMVFKDSNNTSFDFLERIAVPGGWLYRCTTANTETDESEMTVTFVPRPD